MATYWVDTAGSNTSPYDTYAKAANSILTVDSLAGAGDDVYILNTHTQSFATTTAIDFTGGTRSNPVNITSVNSSGVYTKSSIDNFTTDSDAAQITLKGYSASTGVNWAPLKELSIPDEGWIFRDCKVACGTATGAYHLLLNGWSSANDSPIVFDGVDIDLVNTSSRIETPSFYSKFIFRNVTRVSSGLYFIYPCRSNQRGGYLVIEDSNLSNVTSAVVLGNVDDNIQITISRTKIASGVSLISGIVGNPAAWLIARSIDTGDGYHYFKEMYYQGDIEEDTATYRDAGATYNGTNGFSASMIANSNASFNQPLKFELSNFWVDTGDYTTDVTFKVSFCLEGTSVQPAILDDAQFYIEVEHADGADNALGFLVDNKATPLATGTNHSTTTGEWTAGTYNRQMNTEITVTIGTTAGTISSGVVRVNAYLAVDVDSIQTGDLLFVDRKVDVS